VTQREWLEKDFYKTLGVSSDASAEQVKAAYRTLARDLHPDRNQGNKEAEERFKEVSEAYSVLSDPAKRKEYDEARQMFVAGGFGSRGFGRGSTGGGYTAGAPGGFTADFDLGDIFGGRAGGVGDLLGDLLNRGPRTSSRPRRGNNIETQTTLSFRDAALGVTIPISFTSQSACTTCHGSGARPGTSPRVCPNCNGGGVISRNQGAFGFSEPCPDCRGTGSIIDHPCGDCLGTGVTRRKRTVTVRIPPGVEDGKKIRLSGHGEAGLRGAPAGDLHVTVHVTPDPVFSRSGEDLVMSIPVSFSELVLGTTISVPTLGGRVLLKVPPGTADGRTFRMRGYGIPVKDGKAGDLLATVKVKIPTKLNAEATEALEKYAAAERASGFDARSGWAGAS
jgi:molecular chaperone DnaJ